MTDQTTPAAAAPAKKTRKAQGPRVAKPVYALISYKDAEGNSQRLDIDNLTISFTKDSAELVKVLTGPDAASTVVKEVTLPAPTARKPA